MEKSRKSRMAKSEKGMTRLEKAIVETANGLFKAGVMDEETHRRITARHAPEAIRTLDALVPSAEELRPIRRKVSLR